MVFARLSLELNGLGQIDGNSEASVDDLFHHLWISSNPNLAKTCQCGIIPRSPDMTWTNVSTLGQHFLPNKKHSTIPGTPELGRSGEKSLLFDLATPKANAILAAVENAETLSSVGTVIHVL